MRVLYVIDSLVPGGAERSLAALAPAYGERGVALDVAYLQDRPGVQADLESGGATVFCVAGPGGRARVVRRLLRLVRTRRPDLVHTTLAEANIAGRTAARLAGVPVVSSLVNVQYGEEQVRGSRVPGWKLRAARLGDRSTARWVRRFHAITASIADTMGERLGIRPDRIDVVPRGRDARAVGVRTPERRAAARASLGVDDEQPLLLAVARQDRQKGLDVLLRALPSIRAGVPGARLAMVGREGNMTTELRGIVREMALGEAVDLLGTRDDVLELMCAADAFVFPSRWEGLGSVLLEAMALEAPIVATAIPPVREVLGEDGGAAVLVPEEDADSLAEAAVGTLLDRSAAAVRARAARSRFLGSFTTDRVADGMLAFYRRALGS